MFQEDNKVERYSVEEQIDELEDNLNSKESDNVGMVEIKLSRLTQKIIGCEIGENVSTEYPWKFVKKEVIEDNLDLHCDSSEFFPIRDKIFKYPDENILIGYVSGNLNYGKFIMCLSESSRDLVIHQIEASRTENENRVKNYIYKTARYWRDLGSGGEIDETIVKNSRPFYEIEIKKSKSGSSLRKLVSRNAEEQRDGYVELVATRQNFNNVSRRLVSRGNQANPVTSDNVVQTTTWTPINSWFQYSYDYKPINTAAYNQELKRATRKFLERYTEFTCEQVFWNATWDLHADDCRNLVQDECDTQVPASLAFTEYQSYCDIKLTGNKVISDLCWHPLISNIVVAAYATHSKSQSTVERHQDNNILRACHEDNQVLLWSLDDCLVPKFILKSHREVTAVSIRPLDGNVIIGGCSNGQIAIWSISDQIERLKQNLVSDDDTQIKYRMTMKNLMNWMKETTSPTMIYPTAMSSIRNSQTSAITQIIWLASYSKLNENGKLVELEENSDVEELGWQFVTSSEDGTVAFWDLRVGEDIELNLGIVSKQKNKIKKSKKPQQALVRSISPLKIHDGLFSPTYMLAVEKTKLNTECSRVVVITTISFYIPQIQRVEVEPFPIGLSPDNADNIGVPRYYKSVIEKPTGTSEMQRIILVGTLDGDVGRITWDGFDFVTGLEINRESVRWIWRSEGIHDGPVTHSIRSGYLDDIVLTIGGKSFAIWREDFDEPIFFRRSTIRYTACSWYTCRSTVFILARADGTIEFWDLMVKSNEACFTQSLSGQIITGIYPHEFTRTFKTAGTGAADQCVAFCDVNGTMRVFTVPPDFSVFEEGNVEWMRAFVDREVNRIELTRQYTQSWIDKNDDKSIGKMNNQSEGHAGQKVIETVDKNCQVTKINETIKSKPKRTKQFIKEAQNNWKTMESKRMQRVILAKKGLRPEELEKRREPVLKLRQEGLKKKEKIRDMMQQQDRIFEDTVAFLFPERNYDYGYGYNHANVTTKIETIKTKKLDHKDSKGVRKTTTTTSTTTSTTSTTTTTTATTTTTTTITSNVTTKTSFIHSSKTNSTLATPDNLQQIIHNFQQVTVDLEIMRQNHARMSDDSFDWQKTLMEAQKRDIGN
ncbi:dynein axonemal intermediate chain 3-like [Microplitis demolitor]|uniref:dynein axonemal intermediate chain 3-like n=1 Tax=Microplitis demolitor TaxID=69319 RepID=UPI00235B5FC6|nr:dynein axonemal intermediate chain 3-like [Microplitis demolitor]